MDVIIKPNGKSILLSYDDLKGTLESVTDIDTNEKMILQYTQVGIGYDIEESKGMMPMNICKGVYVLIMDVKIYVPKYIFIND